MTKLEAVKKQFLRSVERFDEVLSQEKNDFIRDSAIQRFEFTFDLCWKTLKVILEEEHGVICKSPKDAFREGYKQGILDYDDYWLKLTDFRNQTSHTYNEKLADEIFAQLPEALKHFMGIVESI